ncbi:hypothetical protein GCM10009799_51220 [Nocardiopsis rhodophaea]|uniref:Uncharacterized protein n=1 Tax=Nocardiopsis rhodophaea TaxID=280238 RepID=A0ABN2TPL6_9ACTN
MPTERLRIGEVRRRTAAELEALWRADFDALVTTAIADAEGKAGRVTAETLRSQEWIEDWQDALTWAESELSSAMERMEYESDPRLERNRVRLKRTRRALGASRSLLNQRRKARNSHINARQMNARLTAQSWLCRHHEGEAQEVRRGLLRKAGLPEVSPLRAEDSTDALGSIERCVRAGLLEAEITPDVEKLIALRGADFRNAVADDVSDQKARREGLRHPLLLRRWYAALVELQEMTRQTARGHADGQLPALDVDELHSMSQQEARKVLNARRFFRACQQRRVEWKLVVRRVHHEVVKAEQQVEEPWSQARAEAQRVIVERYPEQYQAVLKVLAPYCGLSGRLDVGLFGAPVRGQVKEEVLDALESGTWRKFL